MGGWWEKKSPTLALEPKWRTRHSAQGLRYCRVKALPNQPYVTHTNTFNLMKTFGFPTSIGRWGFQDQGGCTPLPCLAGRCVSSQCSCLGTVCIPMFWVLGLSSVFRCHGNDMITAVCHLHCLVLVGASFTEQSGHLQVPASRRHDHGCVLSALPCPCRRQLQRAVGPPSGARIETT